MKMIGRKIFISSAMRVTIIISMIKEIATIS